MTFKILFEVGHKIPPSEIWNIWGTKPGEYWNISLKYHRDIQGGTALETIRYMSTGFREQPRLEYRHRKLPACQYSAPRSWDMRECLGKTKVRRPLDREARRLRYFNIYGENIMADGSSMRAMKLSRMRERIAGEVKRMGHVPHFQWPGRNG